MKHFTITFWPFTLTFEPSSRWSFPSYHFPVGHAAFFNGAVHTVATNTTRLAPSEWPRLASISWVRPWHFSSPHHSWTIWRFTIINHFFKLQLTINFALCHLFHENQWAGARAGWGYVAECVAAPCQKQTIYIFQLFLYNTYEYMHIYIYICLAVSLGPTFWIIFDECFTTFYHICRTILCHINIIICVLPVVKVVIVTAIV